MDYLAELDRLIAEADETAHSLSVAPPATGAGERIVRHLIASGAIQSDEDIYTLFGTVVTNHYARFLVRQEQAEKIVARLRTGDIDERGRAALAKQLALLDGEMEEMVAALEDLAAYG